MLLENTAQRMKNLGIAFNPTPVSKSENQIQSIPASSESIGEFLHHRS